MTTNKTGSLTLLRETGDFLDMWVRGLLLDKVGYLENDTAAQGANFL